MAYTPINWDENTPVDATKLNQMDNQIDTNENDLRTIQGGEASVDGRITQNESDITSLRNDLNTLDADAGSFTVGEYSSNTVNLGYTADLVYRIVLLKVDGNFDSIDVRVSTNISSFSESLGYIGGGDWTKDVYWFAVKNNY